MSVERVILLVMDSVGAGETPDAARYGDEGAHTRGGSGVTVVELGRCHDRRGQWR